MPRRSIDTDFWDDSYIYEKLIPIQKLLYIYLLTNAKNNLAGIYEISIKKISDETWIDEDEIKSILDMFSQDEKIFYVNYHIIIKNHVKRQELNLTKAKNIISTLLSLPENVLFSKPYQLYIESITKSKCSIIDIPEFKLCMQPTLNRVIYTPEQGD